MSRKKIYFLSIVLICITFYTYNFMPEKFEIEGGSCYQGIAAMIIRFFLLLCAVLNSIALIFLFRSKVNVSKILSGIAVIIWFLISLVNTIDQLTQDFIISVLYFGPFLIASILFMVLINKIEKQKTL